MQQEIDRGTIWRRYCQLARTPPWFRIPPRYAPRNYSACVRRSALGRFVPSSGLGQFTDKSDRPRSPHGSLAASFLEIAAYQNKNIQRHCRSRAYTRSGGTTPDGG